MSTTVRPNFFLLLELEPDAPWDQATFEQALREKRTQWSRQSTGVGKKALAAKQNLAFIPKMQEIMKNPALREQEAQAACAEMASTRQSKIAQFEKQLAFMNARDAVTQEEVERFVSAFQHLLSPKEIRGRIQVRIKMPATTAPSPANAQMLDPAIARTISERLQFLQLATLYDLLQCSVKTATPELFRAAERLYTRFVLLPPSAETTAKIELSGLARDVFRSEEMRTGYDAYLRQEALDQLLKELVETMSRSPDHEVHPRQVLLFLQQACQQDCSEKAALERLKELARRHQWVLTIPALPPEARRLLCPHCKRFNDVHQHYCNNCQQALYFECPQCGTSVTCEAMACGTCGFAVGNRSLVDRLLSEVRALLQEGDGEQAAELLQEAGKIWQPAQADERVQQIHSYDLELQRLIQAQQQAQRASIEQLRHVSITTAITNGQQQIVVSWEALVHDSIIVLKSDQDLQLEGKVLSVAELKDLGTQLQGDEYTAVDIWKQGSLIYYTPFILLGQKAFAGPSRSFVCMQDIQHLSYQHLGSTLRLHWSWPDDCQEVLLSYSTQQWPQHFASTATTRLVTRADYEQQGYCDIRDVLTSDYYLLVSTQMQSGERTLTTPGVSMHARIASRTVLTYTIKPPSLFQHTCTLHLFIDAADPASLTLPTLLLVSKRGGVPLHKTDGDLFLRIESSQATGSHLIMQLPHASLPPKTFSKLFFEDDTKYHEMILHHPDTSAMQLQ